MKNFIFSCVFIFLISNSLAQKPTDSLDTFAQDLPVPVSNKISLAGSTEPDIVRFLKVGSAWVPTVSPDGEQIAYPSRLTGEFQLWVTHTDTLTAPLQITYGNSVTGYHWSPSGEGILYATDKEGDEKQGYYFISPDGLQEKELLPPADGFRFFGDFNREGTAFTYSTTERNGTDFDIHIYDLQTDTDKKVYKGKLGYVPISFSPNADYVVIAESIGEDANNLYLLRLKDPTLTKINKENENTYSMYENIQWKKNGNGFYLLTNFNRDFLELLTMISVKMN